MQTLLTICATLASRPRPIRLAFAPFKENTTLPRPPAPERPTEGKETARAAPHILPSVEHCSRLSRTFRPTVKQDGTRVQELNWAEWLWSAKEVHVKLA